MNYKVYQDVSVCIWILLNVPRNERKSFQAYVTWYMSGMQQLKGTKINPSVTVKLAAGKVVNIGYDFTSGTGQD